MIDNVPLPFEVSDEGSAPGTESQQKSVRSVAWGRCPGCHTYKAIGLVPQGEHLAWRLHSVMTYGGARVTCAASGQRLCDQPAKQLPGVKAEPVKCRCSS